MEEVGEKRTMGKYETTGGNKPSIAKKEITGRGKKRSAPIRA
jgi:hypothetical protein